MRQPLADPARSAEVDSAGARGTPPRHDFDYTRTERLSNGAVLYSTHRWSQLDCAESIPGDDTLRFHIQISGQTRLLFDRCEELGVADLKVAMLHHQDGRSKVERYLAAHEGRSVTVVLAQDQFRRYLEEECLGFPLALSAASRHDLHTPRLSIWRAAPGDTALARSILQCQYTGALRQLFLESKSLEVMYRVLARVDPERRGDHAPMRINERDRAMLMRAREILEQQFVRTPSLGDLSRTLGINRNKLCLGFKQLFGVTVTEYCVRRRMERARELLLETQTSVSEIAWSVGYSSIGNFSTAFRRHFGTAPTELRRHCPPTQ